LGTAPVAGYESTNYARLVSTGQTLNTALTSISQKIESVRTFAGQTITISFWAKASTGTPSVAASAWQDFGTGGSALVQSGSKVAITSSWARYSVTLTLASIAGKTIAGGNDHLRIFLITSAGSNRDAYTGALGIQSVTIDFWGVQVEQGSTATAFQTATGTLQGELAACQRYYYKLTNGVANAALMSAFYYSASSLNAYVPFPVTMRTSPTIDQVTGTNYYSFVRNGGTDTFNSFTLDQANATGVAIYNNSEASGTAGQAGYIFANNAAAFLSFTSEF
jgi:hypothetical protein